MVLLIVPLVIIVYRNFFITRKGWHLSDIQYHAFFWVAYILLTPFLVWFIIKCYDKMVNKPSLIFGCIATFLLYETLFVGVTFLLCRYFSTTFDGRIKNLFDTIRYESFLLNLFVYFTSILVVYIWVSFEKNKTTSGKIVQLEKMLYESELRLQKKNNEFTKEPTTLTVDKLVIKNGYKNTIISFEDILCFLSNGPYVKIVTEKQTHLLSSSLLELQKRLPPIFLRIHRSHIVNAAFIREARSLLNGDHILQLKNGMELRASRTYRQQLMQVLKRA